MDDFADSKEFSRNSPLLNQLYARGRHKACCIITATQKFNSLSPIIRVNSRQLFFFRLRNYKEIETMVEELSAVLIKKSTVADAKNLAEAKKLLLEVYNVATEELYSGHSKPSLPVLALAVKSPSFVKKLSLSKPHTALAFPSMKCFICFTVSLG